MLTYCFYVTKCLAGRNVLVAVRYGLVYTNSKVGGEVKKLIHNQTGPLMHTSYKTFIGIFPKKQPAIQLSHDSHTIVYSS